MTKPVQSDIETILRQVDSLRVLTLNFTFDGKSYSLDRDETIKVISSGVYRFLWSKYQSKQLQDQTKKYNLMRDELIKRGVNPDSLK